jgi:hypothetical protein
MSSISHTLTNLKKSFDILPIIPEDQDQYQDQSQQCFYDNDDTVIMRLKLPSDLDTDIVLTEKFINVFISNKQSLFYFKLDNNKYTFPLSKDKMCIDLISYILNTLSDIINSNITFDLIIRSINDSITMKKYLKLNLNEIYYLTGNIIAM